MEYLLILNTFRIPRSSLDIQDGIYEKTVPSSVMVGLETFENDVFDYPRFAGFRTGTRPTKRKYHHQSWSEWRPSRPMFLISRGLPGSTAEPSLVS